MVRDIVAAEGEDVFVVGPLASDEADVETFVFEKALFDGGEDGSFAGEADVTDANFGEAGGICGGIGGFVTASEENGA